MKKIYVKKEKIKYDRLCLMDDDRATTFPIRLGCSLGLTKFAGSTNHDVQCLM